MRHSLQKRAIVVFHSTPPPAEHNFITLKSMLRFQDFTAVNF